jgi:hypothetical protein
MSACPMIARELARGEPYPRVGRGLACGALGITRPHNLTTCEVMKLSSPAYKRGFFRAAKQNLLSHPLQSV